MTIRILPRAWIKVLRAALVPAAMAIAPPQLHAQDTDAFDDFDLSGFRTVCFGLTGITDRNALAVCDALSLAQNVRARELAQQWVTDQPESPAAQFALAEVLFRVEGNLPRALFHLNIAESLTGYDSLGRALESGNLEWHYLTLSQLSYAHQLIGNQQKSLDYLEKISQIYGQDTESFRGWPLIKMKRYDEARASAEKVLANSDNPRDRSRAWNTLCAVELADLRPNESLIACENAMSEDTALANSQANDDLNTVHLLNAAEVSLNLLRFEEAENYLNRASRQLDPSSVGNPWVYKLYLYMNQGRFDEARDALDRMLVWRDNQQAVITVMNRADHYMVSAVFLMLAGYADDAARLTQAALNQPDRTGSYTADEAQKDSYSALVNSIAHRLRYQQLRELMATRPRLSNLRLWIETQAVRFRAWRAARYAASLFADEQTLINRMRPYAPLDVHIPEWLEHELMAMMGPGVMRGIVNSAAQQGAFALNEGYYFAYLAEIAATQGRIEQTRELAEQALRLLPAQEVMVRTRLSARLAEALWRGGHKTAALPFYAYVMRTDPNLIRRLGMKIPVNIGGNRSAFATELTEYLRRSPRLLSDAQGLPLEIFPDDNKTVCLRDVSGDALSCIQLAEISSLPVEQQADSDAQLLARQFQQGTFSLPYDISQSQRLALLGNSVIFSSQNNSSLQQRRDAVLQP
jgi:tetratricopeptide (TPR) repeat protein